MRKIFTYLAAFMLPMAVWGQDGGSQSESETTSLITKEEVSGKTYVYANGNPIVITETGNDSNNVLITSGSESVTVDGSKACIFGGSKDISVENTYITLESGTVYKIHGGGNGTNENSGANVTGTATIDINGGKVSYALTSGGNNYCIVNNAIVTVDNAYVQVFEAGGFASNTNTTFDTSFEDSKVKVKTLNFTANNSTFPEGIGCGGGQGYSYTGESIVKIQNCELGAFYGVLYNGNAKSIKAEVLNTTFKSYNNYYEFAAINRGALENAEFVFDGCSFLDLDKINSSLGAINGWANSDTDGSIKPIVKESASFIFKNSKTETPKMQISAGLNSSNLILEGAKAIVKTFDPGTAVSGDINDFSIDQNKTWNLYGGLEIAEGCSLTNNGNLTVKCPDVESLISSVAAGANVIELEDKEYVLDKQLVVNKAVTINGVGINETILTANHKGNWSGSNSSQKNLVSLGGDGDGKIVFNDLTIQNSVASGMNAQTGYDVVLDNVAFKNNTNAGLIVHGSVAANSIVTEGNGWGGVNVDKGTPEYAVSFTFDENCTFNEASKVWSEIRNGNPSTVNAPAGWNTFDLDGKRYWTNEKVATEGEVNVTYSVKQSEAATDKASIKVKYDEKPAMAYNVLPKGKEIEIIVEPLVGYSLQSETSVKVNGGNALTATPEGSYTYTVPNDGTSVIAISAEVTITGDGTITEENVVTGEIKNDISNEVSNPTVVAENSDFNVTLEVGQSISIVSKMIEEAEIDSYIEAILEDENLGNPSISASNTVIYDITPVIVSSGKVVGKAEVSAGSEGVTLALPYPNNLSASDLESVTVYHFADNGDIEKLTTKKKDNYIEVSGVKSFSPFVLTYTVAEPPVVITYHDLHITESVGAKLVSRNGKDRTPDGGSFTLSLEKEEGYEDCEPTVYYKRGRFGEWKELKLDEVSGYYQVRSVYTDIYVKVSGDGIWPVSNEEVEAQEVKVYTQNGAIVVSTPSLMDVQIISMTGAQVAADKVAGQREFRNLAEGIYVVRVGEEIVKVRL